MTTMASRLPSRFKGTTAALKAAVKTSKYRSQRTEVDGISFMSKKEAGRYCELKLLQKAGEISDLKCQPRYDLIVNGQKVCAYVGDFSYLTRDGSPVTEDTKSAFTAKLETFRVKAKLFRALMGREIVIV